MLKRKRMATLSPELIDAKAKGAPVDLRPAIEDVIERNSQVFLKNLRYLTEQSRQTKASIAQVAVVSHEWLRQLTQRGLSQIRQKNREPLERLRRFFNLDSIDDFWSATLISELERVRRRSTAMNPLLRSKDCPYAFKVITLLQTGEHDFVRDLIDTLYRQVKHECIDERGFHMPD